MFDDRLYRYFLSGSIFTLAFAGWLVADPTILLMKLLVPAGVSGTASLSVLALGGGLLILSMGYLCGEVGLMFGWPDPIAPFRSTRSCKCCFCNSKSFLQSTGRRFAGRCTCRTKDNATAEENDMEPVESPIYKCVTCRLRDEIASVEEIDDKNLLEIMTIYTHGRVNARSAGLYSYFVRAWSRVSTAAYSLIGIVAALVAYSLLRGSLCMLSPCGSKQLGEWLIAGPATGSDWCVRLLAWGMVNLFFAMTFAMVICRQQKHRRDLYELLLFCDLTEMTKKLKSNDDSEN